MYYSKLPIVQEIFPFDFYSCLVKYKIYKGNIHPVNSKLRIRHSYRYRFFQKHNLLIRINGDW